MFKLPAKPSSGAHVHELADFAELLAWANQMGDPPAMPGWQ